MRVLEIDVPEYFVTHIGKAEKLAASCMRLTMCVQKGEVLEPRYTCIWPIECLLSRAELVRLIGGDVMGDATTH